MELKVWTEDGIARVVSGVDGNTTCRDVMVAMAQVTGGVGRYCMTLRWEGGCRKLNPAEKPLEVLTSIGGSYMDIRFFVHSSSKEAHKKLKSKPNVLEVHPQFWQSTKGYSINNTKSSDHIQYETNFRNKMDGNQHDQLFISNLNEKQLFNSQHINNFDLKESQKNKPLNVISSSSAFNLYDGGPQKKSNLVTSDPFTDDSMISQFQQHRNKELDQLISNEKKKYAELQDKILQLKTESHHEKMATNNEESKLKDLMEKVEGVQSSLDMLNDELEELQLVSWKNKLGMEKNKGEQLENQTKQSQGHLKDLHTNILSLDEKLASFKEEILAEEDLKHSQESEIEGLKQNLDSWQRSCKHLEDQLQTLDNEISFLQESLVQNEEHLALGHERMMVLRNNGGT